MRNTVPTHTTDLTTVNGHHYHDRKGYDSDSDEFDGLVAQLVAALIDTGQFAHERNDDHLLHSARLVLLQKCTTLTTQEIDAAIARWEFSNHALINYD